MWAKIDNGVEYLEYVESFKELSMKYLRET